MKSLLDGIVQVLWTRFLRVLEGVADALENGINFQQLQRAVRGELDSLGRDILRSVIEAAYQELRENRSVRRGWVVDQRHHEKSC